MEDAPHGAWGTTSGGRLSLTGARRRRARATPLRLDTAFREAQADAFGPSCPGCICLRDEVTQASALRAPEIVLGRGQSPRQLRPVVEARYVGDVVTWWWRL